MIPLITTADLVEFQVLARSENIPPKSEAHPLPLLLRISALFPDNVYCAGPCQVQVGLVFATTSFRTWCLMLTGGLR